jgi:hypothetical protein
MEKLTADELIIIPYTGKCEIIQKKTGNLFLKVIK